MLLVNGDIQIPVIATLKKDGTADINIPDLEMTVHGRDFIAAMANAALRASAVYYYNAERNLHFDLSTTHEDAMSMCEYDNNSFVTYICLVS